MENADASRSWRFGSWYVLTNSLCGKVSGTRASLRNEHLFFFFGIFLVKKAHLGLFLRALLSTPAMRGRRPRESNSARHQERN